MVIELNELTIRALMERSFDKFADLPALAFSGEPPLSYQALSEEVKKCALLLYSQHIQKGDKVVILSDNSPNWVIAYLAITYIGAAAVPILTGFPDSAVRHIIRNSEAVAIFLSQKYYEKIEIMENSSLHTIVMLDDFSIRESESHDGSLIDKTRHLLHLKTGAESTDELPRPLPEDLAAIIYTSGTTGHSKGVMLTHANIVSDVVNSIEKFPLTPDDRFLSILPLSHTFEATGGMLCPLSAGVSIFYMEGLPTPQKLLSAMNEVHPTGVLTVPLVMDKIYRKQIMPRIQSKKVLNTLYKVPFFRKQLNRLAGKKLIESLGGALRFFMFGGAALNKDVEIFLCDARISYSTGYGMTETSPIMTINPFGKVKLGSCGQPIPGIEMKIHEPNPETGIGEIIVTGPIVMQGYYKNPEATTETFIDEKWLRTGDLGYFDTEGYLFIKGRSKNVIIGPSGENIYPEIIEEQLLKSPYIQEVVIYKSQNKLIAKVYPDYDYIDQEFKTLNLQESQEEERKLDILEQVRQEINAGLPDFSRISRIIEYPEPFEKTPTNKVKRYLYIPNED